MFQYRLYGESVTSDRPLLTAEAGAFGAQQALADNPVILRGCQEMSSNSLAHWIPFTGDTIRDIVLSTDRPPAAPGVGQRWHFRVPDIVTLSWTTGDRSVEYLTHRSVTASLFSFWLVHIFIPLYLALEDYKPVLHAAAVEIEGKAFLFTAPSYGGKSTLGSYFMHRGIPMLADDKVALAEAGNNYHALPAHPLYRPNREVESMGELMPVHGSKPVPVAAVYFLQAGAPQGDVNIQAMSGAAAFQSLLDAHLYAFDFRQAIRMRWLTQFVNSVPVYTLTRPWDLARQYCTFDSVISHAAEFDTANNRSSSEGGETRVPVG